jgi:hypothetical protein
MTSLPPQAQRTPLLSLTTVASSMAPNRRVMTLGCVAGLALASIFAAAPARAVCGPAIIQASDNCSGTNKEATVASGRDVCPKNEICVIAVLRPSRTVVDYVIPPTCTNKEYTYEAVCISQSRRPKGPKEIRRK